MTRTTALLLLADGRYPAGGHAHSAGLEAAVAAGRVADLGSLDAFLRGRLATAGLVSAAFAAAACERATRTASGDTHGGQLDDLGAGLDARMAGPASRLASRRQGRALARTGRATWPSSVFDALPHHPHHAVALGVVAAAAGLGAEQAALAAAYGAVTGPAAAAVRLLRPDPYAVQALLAGLADDCDAVAAAGAAHADRPVAGLPAATGPLADIGAEIHASWEVRLFAS
jgi:urease accessory protein